MIIGRFFNGFTKSRLWDSVQLKRARIQPDKTQLLYNLKGYWKSNEAGESSDKYNEYGVEIEIFHWMVKVPRGVDDGHTFTIKPDTGLAFEYRVPKGSEPGKELLVVELRM